MNLSYLFIILEYITKTDKDLGIFIYGITASEAELNIFAKDKIEILLIFAFFFDGQDTGKDDLSFFS